MWVQEVLVFICFTSSWICCFVYFFLFFWLFICFFFICQCLVFLFVNFYIRIYFVAVVDFMTKLISVVFVSLIHISVHEFNCRNRKSECNYIGNNVLKLDFIHFFFFDKQIIFLTRKLTRALHRRKIWYQNQMKFIFYFLFVLHFTAAG